MQILLYLREIDAIKLQVEPDEWRDAFDNALRQNRAVEVEDPNGGRLGVNPRSVLYWKAVPDSPGD